jgi:hypothetical protein
MSEIDRAPEESRNLYRAFLGMTKWSVILVTIVLIALALFLV